MNDSWINVLLFLLFQWMQEKQLVNFKGDDSALPEADLFMLMLVKIPSWVTWRQCHVLIMSCPLIMSILCLLVMKSASAAWCSKRNFSLSWVKWKNTSSLWQQLERVFVFLYFKWIRQILSTNIVANQFGLHCLSPFRTAGVWPAPFSHPPCAEDWKLHECSE